jgi:RNA polymerase sigma-70 factor (ECF subfamily)
MDRDVDLRDEVPFGATAGSGVDLRFEGSAGRPGRCEPEYVLPYSDRERLGALLASLQTGLTAVALRLTRDPEAARDVVQSAFEKVVRHGARFRGHAKVSTWVYRIVANEALMWLRAQRRQARLVGECDEAPLARDPGPGPAALYERREGRRRLQEGLSNLSPDDRDVTLHCALGGLSYAEYAQHSDLHPAAVKSRAHRARCRLRDLLREEDGTRRRPA